MEAKILFIKCHRCSSVNDCRPLKNINIQFSK
jgi:hypothetical protein